MSTTFRPYAPDQMLLLPADLRAWLPEGHLAHHVSDLGDGVDVTAFYAPYAGDGRRNAPSAPRMMVKVLLYAYATGVFSARGRGSWKRTGRSGFWGRATSRNIGRCASSGGGTCRTSRSCL